MPERRLIGQILLFVLVVLAQVDAGPAAAQPGSVWTWGNNAGGQLGTGGDPEVRQESPVRVPDLSGVRSIACGTAHVLALKHDGTVVGWGANEALGTGTILPWIHFTPVPVVGLSNVIQVAAGQGCSFALRSDGQVFAWGYNRRGILGNGTHGQQSVSTVPVAVPGMSDVISISSGREHCLALRADGTVWAWGDNELGQLGNGGRAQIFSSVPVKALGLEGCVAVEAGTLSSFAIKANGTVWVWGSADQLGIGQGWRMWVDAPEQSPLLSSVAKVVYGGHGAGGGARLADGTALGWGDRPEPRWGSEPVLDVDAGSSHVFLRRLDGYWWTEGWFIGNGAGQNEWFSHRRMTWAVGAEDLDSGATGFAAFVRGPRIARLSVTLDQLSGSISDIPFSVAVLHRNQSSELSRRTLWASHQGLDVPLYETGSLDLRIKAPTSLAKRIQIIEDAVDYAAEVTLANGDVNNDNRVNIADFVLLRSAFGSAPGSANWVAGADLNGDGTVGIADFIVLRSSFGLIGD